MHVLLVADGRSPITRSWVMGLHALDYRVTLISTYPCQPPEGVAEMVVLPIAFARLAGSQVNTLSTATEPSNGSPRLVSRFRDVFMWARYRLGPLTTAWYARRYRAVLKTTQPDVVHALRIPFEGMLATYTPPEIPLVVSIWGNDITFHAEGSAAMRRATLRTLRRANGLHADALRDLRLGKQWGFAPEGPTLCVPGGGGIDLGELHRQSALAVGWLGEEIPADAPLIINPRGFRPGSVRNDVFFKSIPYVLERNKDVLFLCAGMAGQPEALQWVETLQLAKHVRLLPFLSQGQLWNLFMRARASVSISSHDGTPNSLLEAMACGCLPIAGDIESLREWITPGVNGLLVEPSKPQALAEAVLLALESKDLRESAAERNLQIIKERAEVSLVRAQVAVFYQRLVGRGTEPFS